MIRDQVGPDWLRLSVAGQLVPLGDVSPLAIRHGRASIDEVAPPSTCSLTLHRAALGALPVIGDPVSVEAGPDLLAYLGLSAAQAEQARHRFVGTVTDPLWVPGPTPDHPGYVSLVAVANPARLGRVRIGDVPWPVQLDGARARAILDLAAPAAGLTVTGVDPGTVSVLARNVDRAVAAQVLAELARDSGGTLAQARNGEVSWHDRDHRRNLAPALQLTARNVLRALPWRQSLDGLVNRVRLTYGEQPPPVLDANGQEVEQDRPTFTAADPSSEAVYGPLDAQLDTQLATLDDAARRARDLVARRSRPTWRVDALAVNLLRTLDVGQAADLLQLQAGELVEVTGFPGHGPATQARLYAEGWTETITRADWMVQLDVVDYSLAGSGPRWADVPTDVRWLDIDPAMTWLGAASWQLDPVDLGRWLDVPSDRQWQDVDPTLIWRPGTFPGPELYPSPDTYPSGVS